MSSYAGGGKDPKPKLLVVKGSFSAMGGAERDVLRNLPALTKLFSIKVATLDPVDELELLCKNLNIPLLKSKKRWELPDDPLSIILDRSMESSLKYWKDTEGLINSIQETDMIHIISGDGSLSLVELVPNSIPIHLHLLEPHRGLHEEVLHRKVDGKPKRNLGLTNALLSRARKRDVKNIKKLSERKMSTISGNSNYTVSRIEEIYGIKAGLLWPSVSSEEFPEEPKEDEEIEFSEISKPYVVNIGRASWAKGTWETISMLKGSGISIAHIGGGSMTDINNLREHADSCNVEVWFAPRLSQNELSGLLRGARASVSMAHGEPFGLTPIEAFSIGTPAIFVNEGGFRDTITNHENGRLISRSDTKEWIEALEESKDKDIRTEWSKAGRKMINALNLSSEKHAERVYRIYKEF
jgi:glycosyltransferase involved in cell wall biosynthesis